MSERSSLAGLERSARWTGARVRLGAGLRRGIVWLPAVLVYAIGALTVIKVTTPGKAVESILMAIGGLLLSLWGALVVYTIVSRRAPNHGAHRLDRFHQLQGRLVNALEFARVPDERRGALMRAAIDDALDNVTTLSPSKAAPLTVPREIGVVVLLAAGLAGIALLEVRVLRYVPPPPSSFKPMVMTADDLELFRDLTSELEQQGKDAQTLAAVRRFNQLIEDIAERRLDRREVFKRLATLEKDLTKAGKAEREATEEGLKGLADELEKSELSKPVAEALKEQRLADAEKAMRELAEKLKNKRTPPTKAELERLRRALERASKASQAKNQSLLEQKEALEKERKRLLDKKKKEGDKLGEQDQKKLDQLERQLERLDRQTQKGKRAAEQMSELDRKLAEAARDLMKAQGASAEDLQSAAQDLNRMAKEEMTREQKQELLKRLQEMREILRQQGAGGQQRLQRLMRFGRKARGQSGRPGSEKGGAKGQGQGVRPGQITPMLVPGEGGADVPMAGMSQGSGQGAGKPGDQAGGGGPGGKEWGTGHDENVKGDSTELKGQTKDVVAAGVDTGEGTASSEVIYGAAQRGFVGRGYQKVYTDYQTVAERVMEQDEIPPGYRFYVRRYFQLIRPRE